MTGSAGVLPLLLGNKQNKQTNEETNIVKLFLNIQKTFVVKVKVKVVGLLVCYYSPLMHTVHN
jgi:hypothetical protein